MTSRHIGEPSHAAMAEPGLPSIGEHLVVCHCVPQAEGGLVDRKWMLCLRNPQLAHRQEERQSSFEP